MRPVARRPDVVITPWAAQVSHVQEDCQRPPTGEEADDYFRWQIESALDYSVGSELVPKLTASLSLQSMHHVMPSVCGRHSHRLYPEYPNPNPNPNPKPNPNPNLNPNPNPNPNANLGVRLPLPPALPRVRGDMRAARRAAQHAQGRLGRVALVHRARLRVVLA